MKLKDIFVPVNSDYARNLREGDILYAPTSEQLEMEVAEDILAQVRETRVGLSGITGKLSVVYEVGAYGSSSTELELLRNRHGVYRKLAPGEKPEVRDNFKTALEHYLRSKQPSKPEGADIPDARGRFETFVREKMRLGNTSFGAGSGEGTFFIESKSQEDAKQASHDLRVMILQECGDQASYVNDINLYEIKAPREKILALLAKLSQNMNLVGPERNRVIDFNNFAQKHANHITCRIKRPIAQGGMYFVDVQFRYVA